jgi:hypothetical protein
MGTFGSSLWGGGGSGTGTAPQGTKVSDLFYMALRLAGVTRFADAGARAPSPDQLGDCLRQGNLMIGQANTNRLMVYSLRSDLYNLQAGVKQYTLGPGGTLISTSGTSVRPGTDSIDRANLVLLQPGGAAPVHLPMRIFDNQQWAGMRLQDIPNGVPTVLYCDYAYPTANVYIWTQDTGADQLELYTWQTLSRLATVNDLVSWPDGYEDWFVNNLAVRLASVFKEQGASVTDDTRAEALRSAAAIESMNAPTPQMDVNPGIMPIRGRSGWNRYTGDVD